MPRIEKQWVKIRYCELCFTEPKDNETFTYIKISDNDNRPRTTMVVCDRCLESLRNLI